MAKVLGTGKSQVGKMDAILRDPHFDTRIEICILMNEIVPKSKYAGKLWERNAKFAKQLETAVQMTAAKMILGCSSATSNTVFRAELGVYPLKTNRDVRMWKWQYRNNMPEKRLPTIVDGAVWEKRTRGRAGTKWDNVVEKLWKELGGDQEEVLFIEKFGGYKTEVKERIEEVEILELRNKVKEKKHSEMYRGLREDIGMKTYLHGPMDYAQKA